MASSRSGERSGTRDGLGVLAYLALAIWLLRRALAPAWMLGPQTTEAWGRSFVSRQVARWLSLDAPPGQADLLNWPDAHPFWPIDPVLQLVQVPAELLLGPGQGPAVAAVVLLTLTGLAVARMARVLGADPLVAGCAGAVALMAPFSIRYISVGVLEAGSLGLVALAATELLLAARQPGPRRYATAFLAVFALAGTAPYQVVYLALACAIVAVAHPRQLRRAGPLALLGAAACALALAPLAATESGDHGRLTDRPEGMGGGPPGGLERSFNFDGLEFLHEIPGGLVLWGAGLAALALPGARRWMGLGWVFFLGGPGVALLMRAMGIRPAPMRAPLHELLTALPVLENMGKSLRMLTPWMVLCAVAAAVALSKLKRGRWLAAVAALLALAELNVHAPGLALPATPIALDQDVLATLDGPTTVFPSGDGPVRQFTVGPKEVHLLAAVAGVPVCLDYGRRHEPGDLALQRDLANAAGLRVSNRVKMPRVVAHTRWVLLLDERLDRPNDVRRWLEDQGAIERASAPSMSAWELPARGAQ